MKTIGLYWFNNDLRLHDNPGLVKAANEVDLLLCVYCLDPLWLAPNQYGLGSRSENRWRWLKDSLQVFDQQLKALGQQLLVIYQAPVSGLVELVNQYHISRIYRSRESGFYELQQWRALQKALPQQTFIVSDSHTLFSYQQLPFSLEQLPSSFTSFKERISNLAIKPSLSPPEKLPPCPAAASDWYWYFPVYLSYPTDSQSLSEFTAGELAGLNQLKRYFASSNPSTYKNTRNALEGWENSTKFSAWLANGNLSARRIFAELANYEQKNAANESTYWIYFELLWREFFHWYAHKHGKALFRFKGIKSQRPLTSFYPQRFQSWCRGNTPYPLVNACIKQLNATGYLSNRGRQIVASCFVNELELDWRYGAAYFEQQLLDYDVAINWGNWQYLAGVGADPRGKRHFDLAYQTKQYDSQGRFIQKWQGQSKNKTLDSVDAADWPIEIPATNRPYH